jgi:hypothetical protein
MRTSTLLVCIVLGCQGASAQVDTGTIVGSVRNPAGEGAAGAKVFLKNEGTSITKSTYTRGDGSYIFTHVKIGIYSVSVELQGFVPAFQTGVVVEIQQQLVVDFNLVASQAASGAAVSSGSTASYTHLPADKLLTAEALESLPIFSRNFTFLSRLLAGVNPGVQTFSGLATTGSFAVNGVQPYQNNYLLDGADNNGHFPDFIPGTAYEVLPAMDAIEEVRVQSPVYSAGIGGATGAVVNAATKSGSNDFHGSAWEYFSNDATNAADFFDNAVALRRAELRKNQFGAILAGPLDIPNFYHGKNKTFFFADYQGTKFRQGVPTVATVPTVAERGHGYTDFSDLTSGLPKCTSGPDVLGRTVNCGTVFDPATTRFLTAGGYDPVTNSKASTTGYARDPFPGNRIPTGRVDSVAASLLNLYPAPTISTIYNNYTTNAYSRGDANQFDVRIDHSMSDRNQVFGRFSYFNNPHLQLGPFSGNADGGGYTQTITAVNGVLSINHVSSSTLVHDFRLAANWMEAQRVQAYANDLTDIPAQHGIAGVPQFTGNGGLSTLDVGIYSPLGSSPYMPAVDYNTTYQISESFTKVRGANIIRGGGEAMLIKAATNQPPYSRGEFVFSGNYTSIANSLDATTGAAQFVLLPEHSSISYGMNDVGGPNQVLASNMSNTDNRRLYYAAYLQDERKWTPRLTITLGARWEYFQPWKENFSAEANFIPGPSGSAQYVIPSGRGFDTLPCGPAYPITCTVSYINTLSTSFTSTLTNDGITLNYARRGSLVETDMYDIGPRFGFAYQFSPRVAVRGAAGMFYGGQENEGAPANLGGNYPFQVNYTYTSPDDGTAITYPSGYANLEEGLAPVTLTPSAALANELVLRGIQRRFRNPYAGTGNLTVQYRRSTNDLFELAYVTTVGHHLLLNPGLNEVNKLLPPYEQRQAYQPFLNFAYGSSYLMTGGNSVYKSGRVQYTRSFGHGLSFLANATYGTTWTDALDFFNVLNPQTYRAPNIQNFGIKGEYQQADFNVRSALHFSGGYELPFGRGGTSSSKGGGPVPKNDWLHMPGLPHLPRPHVPHVGMPSGGLKSRILGGWTLNWVLTVETGQPVTIPCTITTAAGLGCDALYVSGANPIAGAHNVRQYWNPAAFYNPAVTASPGQSNLTPLGGAPTQVYSPDLRRLDAALRRSFQISEHVRAEFRGEVYNVLNHPFFAQPSNLNFLDNINFGQISSTRDNPNDARAIQFAVKFNF